MTATILDGRALAEIVRGEVRAGVDAFRTKYGRVPGLDVVLVGDDPGSVVYTRNKEKASHEVGLRGRLHKLPATASEVEVIGLVTELNRDPSIDGILVQLPLPGGIDTNKVLDLLNPTKDVDGFHPTNVGLLSLGRGAAALVPCTPLGCMRLLALAGGNLEGARAVVVGRSNTVGRPMAELLLAANATVTVAHTFTGDLPAVCRQADVLVVAIGEPQLIRGEWIKPGAVVLDVGINRVDVEGGKSKLVGDVA
ncbi:MAG: bifunctional 5,10-methylenetetrahydrofolate dehydrogenase/5,10-methenyltetrahydrofolate cyclohydrolase, partial [Polyangiaceae bacterium]